VVYILLSLVLTGAVNYRNFDGVGDPLAFIFEKQNLNIGWMQLLVSICAVVAMTSVLLVFQMGQPRIWMSMSRDGLLPPVFQKVHHKFKTPSFATIVTGLVVGLPILFTDKTFVLDFTSIATLFAFVLVCGGVLLIPKREKVAGKFNLPYINSRFIFPAIIIGALTILAFFAKGYFSEITDMKLNDSDKRKVVYSVIADAKSDFHDNYMLTSNELKIIEKRMNDKISSEKMIDAIEYNNKKIDSVIDSEAYSFITNSQSYKKIGEAISDTIMFGTQVPKNLLAFLVEGQKPENPVLYNRLQLLDSNIINKVESSLNQDSALLTKFRNQIYTHNYYGGSEWVPDAYVVITLYKKLAGITVGDIRSESASRLESKTTINVSTIIFWIICIALAVLALVKQWSLIPLLGLTTCLYLLTGMTKANWLWFGSWLVIGLVLYFLYGYKKSKLAFKK